MIKQKILYAALFIVAAGLFFGGTDFTSVPYKNMPEAGRVIISEKRLQHILYGDKTGGGHLYGQGLPCKSEFPATWSGQDIVGNTQRIAANDNLNWKQQKNGYHVADQMIEGVRVRVVLSHDKKSVITAYPINMPRNPCPINDN